VAAAAAAATYPAFLNDVQGFAVFADDEEEEEDEEGQG